MKWKVVEYSGNGHHLLIYCSHSSVLWFIIMCLYQMLYKQSIINQSWKWTFTLINDFSQVAHWLFHGNACQLAKQHTNKTFRLAWTIKRMPGRHRKCISTCVEMFKNGGSAVVESHHLSILHICFKTGSTEATKSSLHVSWRCNYQLFVQLLCPNVFI